jgi:hypothetical protein
MALLAGTRLGPYEIVAAVGAGGMGEVYRARDTRLDRTVAIKILPAHLSSNAALKQRFEREAKTISSLNHPHICTLYDVGTQDGTDFLVMEYLEGRTLADRLHAGSLPLESVLQIGAQITGALEKAHRQGIVHRDLKPGNIMLTDHGAKLMDFGLAKPAATALGATFSAANAPTADSPAAPLTGLGAIVGTFQYMSPEQLEGVEPDFRADLFSLGVTLYEMATGRHPFEGVSPASTIAHILSSEPAPLQQRVPAAPAELDRIVRKCLRKKREERYQSTSDLLVDLQSLQSGPAERTSAAPSTLRLKWWWPHQIGQILVAVLVFLMVWAARAALPASLRQFLFIGEVFALGLYGYVRFELMFVAISNPNDLAAEARRMRVWIRVTGWAIIVGMVTIALLILDKSELLAAGLVAVAMGGVATELFLEPAMERSAFGDLAAPRGAVGAGHAWPATVMALGQLFLAALFAIGALRTARGVETSLWQWAGRASGTQEPNWVLAGFCLFFAFLVLLALGWAGMAVSMWRSPAEWAQHIRRWIVYFFLADSLCAVIGFVAALKLNNDILLGLLVFVLVLTIPFLQALAAQRLAPGKRPSLLALLLPWTKL